MGQNDVRQLTTPRSAGSLAFTLGCLPLTLVGLIVELVGAGEASFGLQVLLLAGWLLTGAIAATGFFLISRLPSKSGPKFIGELTFCAMGITAAVTTSASILIPYFTKSPAANALASESTTGFWVLGVLLGMGALLLPTSIWQLLVLWVPSIGIWIASLFIIESNDRGAAAERIALQTAITIGPSILISLVRMRTTFMRRQREVLERRVKAFGGELDRAREIHDSMFPDPLDGDIRLEYTYDPLLGIGGDFLHVYSDESTGKVTLTILDVSGHGLAAALTVNRLFGELERICAEHPNQVSPSLLMTGLNRYVHLVMAKHSLYATAASIQMDPGNCKLHWVVSGHPPPLLRRRNGTVEDLDCTSVILGALSPDMFDPQEKCTDISLGDLVLVYTDGTFESRNATGEFFGLKRLRETLAFDTPPRDWSRFVTSTVERFRGKHSGQSQSVEDDLLVASIALAARRRVIEISPKSQDVLDLQVQASEPAAAKEPSPTEDPSPPE